MAEDEYIRLIINDKLCLVEKKDFDLSTGNDILEFNYKSYKLPRIISNMREGEIKLKAILSYDKNQYDCYFIPNEITNKDEKQQKVVLSSVSTHDSVTDENNYVTTSTGEGDNSPDKKNLNNSNVVSPADSDSNTIQVGDSSTQNAPTQDAPTQNAPVQVISAQDAPTQDTPTQDAPAQDAPTQDAPTQDTAHDKVENLQTDANDDGDKDNVDDEVENKGNVNDLNGGGNKKLSVNNYKIPLPVKRL